MSTPGLYKLHTWKQRMNTHNRWLKEWMVQSTLSLLPLHHHEQFIHNARQMQLFLEHRSGARIQCYQMNTAQTLGRALSWQPAGTRPSWPWEDRHQSGGQALPETWPCPAAWDRHFRMRHVPKRTTYIDSKMLSDSSAMLPQHAKRKAFLQKDPGFVFVF